jgi:iron-sulfur cluster assembly protein
VLTITPSAAEAIQSIVSSAPDVPDTGGLRIARQPGTDGQEGFGLSLAAGPEPDDEVVEEQSASIYMEPETASLLEDKVLDASVDGDRVGFMLAERG